METNAAGQSIPVLGCSSEQSIGLNNDRVPITKALGITLEYYLPNNRLTNITRADCRAAENMAAVIGKNLVNNLNYRDTCIHLA